LCDAGDTVGFSWGEDGNIIAALQIRGPLIVIPSSGGNPKPFTTLAEGEATHRWPQVLPGGKAVLFISHIRTGGYDEATIEAVTIASGQRKKLHQGASWSRYLPSGHLIYLNKGTLFAVPFDSDRLEIAGTPVPMLEKVLRSSGSLGAHLDFSTTGTVVYREGDAEANQVTVQWMDRTGKTAPLLAKLGNYLTSRVSPDGRHLVLTSNVGNNLDIWVYDWQRDTMTRLTFDAVPDVFPVWSPDGRHIFYRTASAIAVVRADGAGKPQILTEGGSLQTPGSFTPDGKRLAYSDAQDLWTLPLELDQGQWRAGKPEPFLKTPFVESSPAFSVDGKWLAYTSNETGGDEILVRAFPESGAKWQISSGGGAAPVFSRNGRELFYRAPGGQIMVAAYKITGGSFVADKPVLWSEARTVGFTGFDLAPDGKRFAIVTAAEGREGAQPRAQVTFLFNFFDELRRKVPVQ
jgi:serine/threonine-protein kinase